ncbi:DUF2599 domain-containing protein [Micrococcales bacterium 31B]|nr:DUF2599 domain-containing protein [Micrococcales bacterium 31B]
MPTRPRSRGQVALLLVAIGTLVIALSFAGMRFTSGPSPVDAPSPTATSPATGPPDPSTQTPDPSTQTPDPTDSSEPADPTTRASDPTPSPQAEALLAGATWARADGGRSLMVSPGAALRGDTDLLDAAWQELITAHPEANTDSMFNQFRCHAQYAASKTTWNLEPWRPATPYAQTVLALCNPGPAVEPSGT